MATNTEGKMTNAELIRLLQALPPELPAVLNLERTGGANGKVVREVGVEEAQQRKGTPMQYVGPYFGEEDEFYGPVVRVVSLRS